MLRALKDFASCVGTYFSVLSYGKFAKNEYLRSSIQNGIDVMNPDACMVVNISMYTTDVVVFVKGRVILLRSCSIGCDALFDDIIAYMFRMHHMLISRSLISTFGT